MAKAETREEWAGRVASWREGGLSARAFATGKACTAHGLYQWARELQRPELAREPTEMRFAHVVLSDAEASPSETAIVIEACGVRVDVWRGFDQATLGPVR